ncbi:hypothetical protein [Micromonospora ureilytica]|nr:hypothetical protein [Micromonospora ureilytica]
MVTLVVTLIGEFVLKLTDEGTYFVFVCGAMATVVVALLQIEIDKKVDSSLAALRSEMVWKSALYEHLEKVDDVDLRKDIYELVEQIGKGKIPPHITATRSRSLLSKVSRSMKTSYYAPDVNRMREWRSHSRQRTYFEGNISAVSRGVRIERTFLIRRADAMPQGKWDDEIEAILKEQIECGIEVRVLWLEDLEIRGPRFDVEQEFAIFDDREVMIVSPRYGNSLYRLPSERVAEYKEVFGEQLKYTVAASSII